MKRPEVVNALLADDDATPDEDPRQTGIQTERAASPKERLTRQPPSDDLRRPRSEIELPIRRPKVRSVRRRVRDSGGPSVAFEPGWFGSVNSGVVGGLLMMVIAVVWFGAGLMAGIIFFYPPVLLVIGFIAMIRGLFNGR
jgi:hypothetical protein